MRQLFVVISLRYSHSMDYLHLLDFPSKYPANKNEKRKKNKWFSDEEVKVNVWSVVICIQTHTLDHIRCKVYVRFVLGLFGLKMMAFPNDNHFNWIAFHDLILNCIFDLNVTLKHACEKWLVIKWRSILFCKYFPTVSAHSIQFLRNNIFQCNFDIDTLNFYIFIYIFIKYYIEKSNTWKLIIYD